MIDFVVDTDFGFVNTAFLLMSIALGIGMLTSPKLKYRTKIARNVAACFLLVVLRLALFYAASGWTGEGGKDLAGVLDNSFIKLLLDGGVFTRLIYILFKVRVRQELAAIRLLRMKRERP